MISILAFALIASGSNALILNCTFSAVQWTFVGSVYTCTGTILFQGDPRNVTIVNGNHLADRENADIEAIALSNQNLQNGIPMHLENFFPLLNVLSVANSNVRSVSASELSPHSRLRVLILVNNEIESIEGDLFTSIPLIEYINLSSNRLRHFGPNIFDPLNNLRTLRLTNNVCINQYVDNNATMMMQFRWHATFSCPPSFEQLERQILGGQSFENALNPLIIRMWWLEQRILQLENGGVINE